MSENQGNLERLQRLLTEAEAEKLAVALEAVRRVAAGWGDIQIKIKAGRIDSIEITTSLIIRNKKTG